MFRVAICDDNSIFLTDFENRVRRIFQKKNIRFAIDCFTSVNDFIQETETGTSFQLLFLDIEFSNSDLNGISGADYVRTHLAESHMHIVFISNQSSHALSLFDFQPLQFLIKPILQDKLEDTINKALQSLSCESHTFQFRSNRQEISIDVQQILYIESFGRQKKLHCSSGKKYIINDSISNILIELEPYDFFTPHKSYIVNYHKVIAWHKDSITIENGDILPISRAQTKNVHDIQFHQQFN